MGTESEEDFDNLFEDMDLNSSKLGKTTEARNAIIAKVLSHLDKIDFQLNHTQKFGKDEVSATLHFKKSNDSEMYFFNKYDAALKPEKEADAIQQTFYINKEMIFSLPLNNFFFSFGFSFLLEFPFSFITFPFSVSLFPPFFLALFFTLHL